MPKSSSVPSPEKKHLMLHMKFNEFMETNMIIMKVKYERYVYKSSNVWIQNKNE